MPGPNSADRSRTKLSEEEIAQRLAALNSKFGAREVPFYLNTPGDYAIGVVEETGEFTHEEFGTSPQITLRLEDGVSAETPDAEPGQSYVLRLFPKAVKGRSLKPGDRIAVANYGTRRNKADTYDYQDIVLRILPAEA